MKGLTPGAGYSCSFACGLENPDPSTVVVTVVRSGAVDANFSITVTRPATGIFWLSGVVPTTYVAGDPVGVYVKYTTSAGGSAVQNVDLFLVEDAAEVSAKAAVARVISNVFG